MPTVYKIEITKVNGELKFSPIYKGEWSDDMYNKFKWDKLNMSHFLDSDKTIIMSDKEEWLTMQHIGAESLLFIWQKWEEIFSEENKKKFKES